MKRPKNKTKRAYYIGRTSHVDDSLRFNFEGHRIYFDKPQHARRMMANIDADQQPKLLRGPVLEGDVPFAQVLDDHWLVGTGVTSQEYLAAIEEKGEVSNRQARAFLERMRRLTAT